MKAKIIASQLLEDNEDAKSYIMRVLKKPKPPSQACPHCGGDGEEPGAPVDPNLVAVCMLCKGKGVVTAKTAKQYYNMCDECGADTKGDGLSCPDGAYICRDCFDAGLH